MSNYQLKRDLVIPAGTLLTQAANERGGHTHLECSIAHGPNFTSFLVVQLHPDAVASGDFEPAA